MTPPPKESLSTWADRNRVLSAESSAEPGRWRTKRAEYLRGIMDAFTDPAVKVIVVRKAAQVGYTEVLNNAIGYHIDRDPATVLLIQPTVKMAETWSKKRLAPMLRDTPCLQGKVKDPKSRDSDNTILEKGYPGGYIAIVGANTPNDLASRPMRVVIADEVDKYPPSAGGFGDPLTLAATRQRNFWNRKMLIGSTPGEARTSTVHRWFLRGDQRRFMVPCPHCGHRQALVWGQIDWHKDVATDGTRIHRPETSVYLCEDSECGTAWSDAERWRAISEGEWAATAPFDGIASFDLPGWLSPWLTLKEIVEQFLAAKDYAPLLRTWINEVKGEPWEERGESTNATALSERLEAYDGDTLPEAVRLVTAGVDTHGDRLEVSFVGWGEGEEAWVIGHELILGDPGTLVPWNDLDRRLREAVFHTESGRPMRVRATCIDSGGHHGGMVLGFARTRAARRIYAIKGVGNDHRGSKPIWAKALLGTKNAGDKLWAVGVDTAKDDLAARLRIVPGEGPTPRAVHFPMAGLPVGYFEQLTAEQVVTEINAEGRRVRKWKLKPGQERNEALDCFNYAQAAMLSLGVRLMPGPVRTAVLVAEPANDEPEEAEASPEPPAETPPQPQPRRRRERWRAYGG
jgi:phage terminase large subunit GpA-like protein